METKVPTKKDNIKQMYVQVNDRIDYITKLADHLGKSVHTLQNHWFSGFWAIPEKYLDDIIAFTQNYLLQQNNSEGNE